MTVIIDLILFIPNKCDIKDPVQTPVPGNGIATNKNKPKYPYLSICSLLAKVLSVILEINLSKNFIFLKRIKTNPINNIMGIAGNDEPKNEIKKDFL